MTGNKHLALAVLLGTCLVTSFLLLGARPIWNVDEGMHSVTSVEMVRSGDWIVPTFNGEPFYDKPAFHNWLVALSFLALGFTEFAARLPSALLGLGTVLATALHRCTPLRWDARAFWLESCSRPAVCTGCCRARSSTTAAWRSSSRWRSCSSRPPTRASAEERAT